MNRSFSFFSASLLLCISAVLFTTCAKEYSYEGGNTKPLGGTAVYTLEGAGGACIGSVVMGKYYAGSALGPTHNIQLQVNVTTTGTYTLTTNTVNGIRYSVSGTFTSMGIQPVTLAGTGTPATTGSFTFTTTGSACSFTITVNKLADAVAEFTLAGAPGACTNAVIKGEYVNGRPLTAFNIVEVTVDVTAIGAYTIRTDTLNGISFFSSGMFTTTGAQTVVLAGSGTPPQPEKLIFTPSSPAAGSACTFTITVQNREPVATYVIESGSGNGNSCIYTLSGMYTANTSLSASNSVRINVFVTVLGNYTIATSTVNGMKFYHTGMFTITGAQSVSLTGSGTPLVTGNFSFTPMIVGPSPLGGQACSFPVMVN